MSIYIFLGPTLTLGEARAELDADYLPPAAQGDVARLVPTAPQAIGIIDGYFRRMPAVWHKEILWAMDQGVHVFGSSSMGALRAAELESFGMVGVGTIFQAYRDGTLTADDEVAVTHGPAETGYAPQSEAMVNIRGTLAAAAGDGVLSEPTRAALERIAKRLFYPDRVYPVILRRAAEEGQPRDQLDAVAAWLPVGRVDQKRADALALLRHLRERLGSGTPAKQVGFRLERTLNWLRASQSLDLQRDTAKATEESLQLDALLDEIGLAGDAFDVIFEQTLLSYLALREAERVGYRAGATEVAGARTQFRAQHGLSEPEALAEWLRKNSIRSERLDVLLGNQVVQRRLSRQLQGEILARIPDHLRIHGSYVRFAGRALNKRRALAERGMQNVLPADLNVSLEALFAWHFDRLGRRIPADIDSYALSHGFANKADFLRALAREHCLHQMQADGSEVAPFDILKRALFAGLRRAAGEGTSDKISYPRPGHHDSSLGDRNQ